MELLMEAESTYGEGNLSFHQISGDSLPHNYLALVSYAEKLQSWGEN
jgi:hypothetical protein